MTNARYSEEALGAVLRGTPGEAAAEAAAYVFTTGQGRRDFESVLYPEDECALTPEERETIHAFVAARCRKPSIEARMRDFIMRRQEALIEEDVGAWRLAAAPGAAAAVKSAAPSAEQPEDVTFVFLSGDGAQRGWRASLAVPAKADADTPLDIFVEDGAGAPVDGGLFRIAGVALPLMEGRSAIPFGMFLSGMKEAGVSLTFSDGLTEGGSLAFM